MRPRGWGGLSRSLSRPLTLALSPLPSPPPSPSQGPFFPFLFLSLFLSPEGYVDRAGPSVREAEGLSESLRTGLGPRSGSLRVCLKVCGLGWALGPRAARSLPRARARRALAAPRAARAFQPQPPSAAAIGRGRSGGGGAWGVARSIDRLPASLWMWTGRLRRNDFSAAINQPNENICQPQTAKTIASQQQPQPTTANTIASQQQPRSPISGSAATGPERSTTSPQASA